MNLLTDISGEIKGITNSASCIVPGMPKKKESLQDLVRRIMREKKLSLVAVAKNSGGGISAGYVNDFATGKSRNPSMRLAKGLAKGLGITVEEIFAAVDNHPLEETTEFRQNEIVIVFNNFNALKEADRKELRPMLDILKNEIERRLVKK